MTNVLRKEKRREASRPGAAVKSSRKIAWIALMAMLIAMATSGTMMVAGIGVPGKAWLGMQTSSTQ